MFLYFPFSSYFQSEKEGICLKFYTPNKLLFSFLSAIN